MSVERCTQCERSFDLDFQGMYIKELPYCDGCAIDCDCGETIPSNEDMCQSCHIKEARS